jgi:hypothetical protein
VQLDVARRRAHLVLDRRLKAQELFDRGGTGLRSRDEERALVDAAEAVFGVWPGALGVVA